MEVEKRTTHQIFNMPQRLLVPLFQRRYTWSQEAQWAPLWEDIIRVASRCLHEPSTSQQPHFFGAVVLQQLPNATGGFQTRTIIDGQQRLTTLQILLDALHAQFEILELGKFAKRIEPLVRNGDEYCNGPDDRFKVWPTNNDRPSFREVMSLPSPIDYSLLEHKDDLIPKAHHFFSKEIDQWLTCIDRDETILRADALEKTIRELLQIVVIDLSVDENAQEIFEALNARGAPLSAADLIKNFVFQRLLEEDADTESAYETHWKHFENTFWETTVSIGRLNYKRSSLFLQYFLVSRTGEMIGSHEVFSRFKSYALHDSGLSMIELLQQIKDSAYVYAEFVQAGNDLNRPLSLIETLSYRMSVLDTDSITPIVMYLLEPNLPEIEKQQMNLAIQSLESYLVRRAIIGVPVGGLNRFFTSLLSVLLGSDRTKVGTQITEHLASQTGHTVYWPDDKQIETHLSSFPIDRIGRRLRMILEAVEDHRRGFSSEEKNPSSEAKVVRGKLTLEHLIPRKWKAQWPLIDGETEISRNTSLRTLGNLTLLTQKLNSKISNGPWLGTNGKAVNIDKQSTLLINRDLTLNVERQWTTVDVKNRTTELTSAIIAIWKVPPGHVIPIDVSPAVKRKQISILDVLSARVIEEGLVLCPRFGVNVSRTCSVTADGKLVTDDGVKHDTPSGAGRHFEGRNVGGWWYWKVEGTDRLLGDLKDDYIRLFNIDEVIDEDDIDER